jgi:hypothetical protein
VGGACSPNNGKEKCVYVIGGKVRRKEPLGRPRFRWLYNIKMDRLEIVCGGVDWIVPAQDRDKCRAPVSAVINLRAPQNAGKLSSVQTTRDLSSSAQLHGVS